MVKKDEGQGLTIGYDRVRILGNCDGSSFSGLVGVKTGLEEMSRKNGSKGSVTSLNPHNYSVREVLLFPLFHR